MARARFSGKKGSFEPSLQKDVEVGYGPGLYYCVDIIFGFIGGV